MHIDIACSFPLNEMVDAHMRHRSICTMLGTKVPEKKDTSLFHEDTNKNSIFRFLLEKLPSTVVLLLTLKPTKFFTMLKSPIHSFLI
jgi:NDP-sugar pyrophosphorylase family protein